MRDFTCAGFAALPSVSRRNSLRLDMASADGASKTRRKFRTTSSAPIASATTATSATPTEPLCLQSRSSIAPVPSASPKPILLAEKYVLLDNEQSSASQCVHLQSRKVFLCKTLRGDASCRSLLNSHMMLSDCSAINKVQELIKCQNGVNHVLFDAGQVDLHTFVRGKRRLRESEARRVFAQIALAVHDAHHNGLVLRDLKLRKFVVVDTDSLETRLESLADSVLLSDPHDDQLSEKHGCPAYVSPEILRCNSSYSGRAADMWSLGVMLYTMIVGRYPFHGHEHSGLFAKIRRGHFTLPDSISSRAKCLIRCLLKKDPGQRISAEDVLAHPFLKSNNLRGESSANSALDQLVPQKMQKGVLTKDRDSGSAMNNGITALR